MSHHFKILVIAVTFGVLSTSLLWAEDTGHTTSIDNSGGSSSSSVTPAAGFGLGGGLGFGGIGGGLGGGLGGLGGLGGVGGLGIGGGLGITGGFGGIGGGLGGGGLGGLGGGGGGGMNSGKSREAAQKIIQQGDDVRKNIEENGKKFNESVSKLTDNFNSSLSSISKNAESEDYKDAFKQIADVTKSMSKSTPSTAVDEIIDGYKKNAELSVKKASAQAISFAPQGEVQKPKQANGDVISKVDVSNRPQNTLARIQNSTVGSAADVPTLGGGTAIPITPGNGLPSNSRARHNDDDGALASSDSGNGGQAFGGNPGRGPSSARRMGAPRGAYNASGIYR